MKSLEQLIGHRIRWHWRGRGLSLSAAKKLAETETLTLFLEASEHVPDARKLENIRQALLYLVRQ